MVLGLNGGTTDTTTAISTAIAVAIPLSVAGLFLTMICRTIAIPMFTSWMLLLKKVILEQLNVGKL